MLGRSEFALRQGFACGKRLYGAKAPPARRPVGCVSSKIANNLRGFGIVTPCQKERHDFCRVFLFGCRSLWHFDALSVKALPAQLFSPADLRITAHQRRRSEDRSDISIAQILTVPSTSEQVLYRLLDLFYKSGDACFAVFSFPLHPASSGSQWAGPACGRYSPTVSSRRKVSASTDASLLRGPMSSSGRIPALPSKMPVSPAQAGQNEHSFALLP